MTVSAETKTEREDLASRGLKRCSRCREIRPLEDYHRNTLTPDGLRSDCRSCYSQRRGGSYAHPRAKLVHMLTAARTRARNAGMVFELTYEWLLATLEESDYTCAVTGLPFVFAPAIDSPTSISSPWMISLDRVDSSLGYTEDNVQVVCFMYNAAKNGFADTDVLHMARALVARQEPAYVSD